MTTKTLLILPLLMLFAACAVQANSPAQAEPGVPGVTKVEPGTKIEDIKSDDFSMNQVSVEGDILTIKVSYAGGEAEHDFKLYWNGIVAKSYPGKTGVVLKHNANGDNAEALITATLQFDLTQIGKPMIITVTNDHGDTRTVQYGESKLD